MMRDETDAQKRVRELQREAWQIQEDEKKAKRLAAVAKLKQVEGWEQKVCDAVLAAIHAGEGSAYVKVLEFAFPPTADPLDNVSSWISASLDVVWLDYPVDAEDVQRYADWDGPRRDRYGNKSDAPLKEAQDE